MILLFVNKVLRVKASGHACGISGPFTLATVYFGWIAAAIGVATLILVYFASIKMGRHTTSQYITGSLISVPMVLLSAWIAGIF